jgi:hypothetical protein
MNKKKKNELYCFDIGNDKDVRLLKEDNKLSVVIPELSTKESLFPKEVTINIQQWWQLQQHVENTSEALITVIKGKEDVEFMHPLDRGLFIQVHSPYRCVTIREFTTVEHHNENWPKWNRPSYREYKLEAMRNGIAVRELEWKCVKEHMSTRNVMIDLQSFKAVRSDSLI